MFANISTKELFAMNTSFFRQYEADKTEANLQDVLDTGAALTARGAW